MVDPRQVARDARVQKGFNELSLTNWPVLGATEAAESEKRLIAAICAAHLDALAAGEGLDFEAALEAVTDENLWNVQYEEHLDRQHRAIVGALRAKLAAATDRIARLEEPWTDEHGTAWLAPTAHAYAMTCKALDEKREKLAAAEARADELAERLESARRTFGTSEVP